MKNDTLLKISLGYIHLIYFLLCKRGIRFVIRYRKKRNFVLDKERQLIYLNNPKVACSSIKETILGKQIDLHAFHISELPQGAESFYKFTFVRNPYERLVSCFEEKFNSGKSSSIRMDYLFGYLKDVSDFETFITRISVIPFYMSEPHVGEQYWLTHDEKGRCIVDFIGKIENMNTDFQSIQERFNLPPLPHKNRSAPVTGRNWMDYYDQYTAELVYWKYKNDFITFGYMDECEKLKIYLKNKASQNKGKV